MRKMRKRRFGGNSSPDWREPPWGGAWARGANGKPRSPAGRRGLPDAALGGAGGGKQRASKKANGREPPGGRTGRGAHGKPQSPAGRRGLPGEPLGGAGENISRQGYCAPELRGRRGVNLVDMRY